MTEGAQKSAELEVLIQRMQAGDQSARDELITRSYEPLLRLARKMLRDFPRVHRWEDTDDVLHASMLRLRRALETIQPQSVKSFISLAAMQIRRQLLDLARHYYGKTGAGTKHASVAGRDSAAAEVCDKQETTHDPTRLAEWCEFHAQVENLPEREREVFDLHWYQGLSHGEVARILNVSEETARQRWRSARLKLHNVLKGTDKKD